MKDTKEIALSLIAPYYKDPSKCAFSELQETCVYLTSDGTGRMCVAGSAMNETFLKEQAFSKSISEILRYSSQVEVFKPEFVGVLSTNQWQFLQSIHDCIEEATRKNLDKDQELKGLRMFKPEFNPLFTIEELKEYANKQ